MNKQRIFNIVWKHANNMEKPAFGLTPVGENCMYRSHNGPCLIGILIDNDHYSKELEGENAESIAVCDAVSASTGETEIDGFFLQHLQDCHDHSVRFGKLKKDLMLDRLEDVAIKYNLVIPE